METEYLKDHFDMRVYGIVGHLHAKLDSVKHASDTRTVNIKIKEGEDTYNRCGCIRRTTWLLPEGSHCLWLSL